MGRGAFLSGAFHVIVLLLIYLGLPAWFAPEEFQQPIPVELATLSEITTPPKSEAPAPEPTPAAKPEPPKAEAPPPPPEPPAPAPEPEVAEQPAPTEAVPEPAPAPEEAVEPEPAPDIVPAEKPKPPAPTETQQAEAPPPQDPLASLLKNVEKLKDQPQTAAAPAAQPATPAAQPPQNLSDQPLTMSEIDWIRQQISRCWNIPAGARDAENLIVEIRAVFNPDGSVARAEIVDTGRMASDPFYRAAAESAYRAVLQCSPLQMPPKKYNVWKIVTLRFNPKEMLGT